MRTTDVESICIFGSAARSSRDEISDRDVLVVADNWEKRQRLVEKWSKGGWSVASYSPKRVATMIGAGSLFVQHLKLEGILIGDRDGWLRDALGSAEAKKSYEVDANNSVFLALPIERFASEELLHNNLIVSDLAYVAFRNFGICYLADRGLMVFDYHTIVESVGKEFGLSLSELRLMHSLRAGKVAYRMGYGGGEMAGTVGELRLVLSKFFSDRPLRQIQPSSPVRDLGAGYATLRDFEAAVIKGQRECEEIGRKGQGRLERLLSVVRDPRMYAWDVRNLRQAELESIRVLVGGSRSSVTTVKHMNSECASRVLTGHAGLAV